MLCEVVKAKMDPLLKDYPPSQLVVFPAGTTNFLDNTKVYKRGCQDFPKVDDENFPLIVVAPQKESGTCVVVLPWFLLFCWGGCCLPCLPGFGLSLVSSLPNYLFYRAVFFLKK